MYEVPPTTGSGLDRVVEADQGVVDERRRLGDPVEIQRQTARDRVEGEIDLARIDRSPTASPSARRVGDRQGDPVARVAAEVVPDGRDREAAALDARDRSPGMDVAVVEEVDVPGEGAGGQRAVVGVGCRRR